MRYLMFTKLLSLKLNLVAYAFDNHIFIRIQLAIDLAINKPKLRLTHHIFTPFSNLKTYDVPKRQIRS